MKKLAFIFLCILISCIGIFGQLTLPRESTRQEIVQMVGDSKIGIVYHRPNVKGREGKIYGCKSATVLQVGNNTGACLVPDGQVWRAGANENTVLEFSTDVTINGQPLPAGKYGFFAIPDKKEWTLIFNKVNSEWGAFTYKEGQDALRLKVIPIKSKTSRETLAFEFNNVVGNSAQVVLSWEKLSAPFTVNVGDVQGRTLAMIRQAIKSRKADDQRPLNQGTGYVLNNKIASAYEEALGWINESIKVREGYGNLVSKARLLAEMGRTQDAIATGEKAVQVGKAATPPADTSAFEKTLAEWKAKK